MGKSDKLDAAMDAQRTVMHRTGHVAFTHQQSEVLKQLYRTEARTQTKAKARGAENEEAGEAVERDEHGRSKNVIQMPVGGEEIAVLLNGTSREGGGRAEYLKLQAKKAPKQRFLAPVTSSQLYGWDYDLAQRSSSEHSRKAVLKHTCERTRGVFNPDLS